MDVKLALGMLGTAVCWEFLTGTHFYESFIVTRLFHCSPELNEFNVTQSINKVTLDRMCSVVGKFRNKNAPFSNKEPEYYCIHFNNEAVSGIVGLCQESGTFCSQTMQKKKRRRYFHSIVDTLDMHLLKLLGEMTCNVFLSFMKLNLFHIYINESCYIKSGN